MGFIITEPYSYYNDEEREKQKREIYGQHKTTIITWQKRAGKKKSFLIERDEPISSDAQIPSAAVAAL